jgi:optic atrophy 3 protein
VSQRAVENGANALAEGFLFAVAAALIIGEQWRSSRSQSRRKEDVDDKLEALDESVKELNMRLGSLSASMQEQLEAERKRCVCAVTTHYTFLAFEKTDASVYRSTDLARILERVVEIGLHGGWSELEQTPLRLPRIDLSSSLNSSSSESESSSLSESDDENDSDSGMTSSSEDGRIDTEHTGKDDKSP